MKETSSWEEPSRIPEPDLRVLGVGGSPRKKGNSDLLLQAILSGVEKEDVPVEAIYLRDHDITPCIGCEKCRRAYLCTGVRDDMSDLYPLILKARGLVLTCPTHHYNVTAWMKAFMDRFYCFYAFDDNRPRGWKSRLAGQGRKAVISGVCEQVDRKDMGFTLEAMRLPLEAWGYEVVGELPVTGLFDRGRVAEERGILDEALSLGKRLARSLDI